MREHVLGFVTLMALMALVFVGTLLAIVAAFAFCFLFGYAAGVAGAVGKAARERWLPRRVDDADQVLHREADKGAAILAFERSQGRKG